MIVIQASMTSHSSILRKLNSGLRALPHIRDHVCRKHTNSNKVFETCSVYEVSRISPPQYEIKCRIQTTLNFALEHIKAVGSVNTLSPFHSVVLKRSNAEILSAFSRNGGNYVVIFN
ncbi:MAG: hypothetical protein ACJAS1_006709 [Oleiphilaceae bacterium]|jgi:hypothetical protein